MLWYGKTTYFQPSIFGFKHPSYMNLVLTGMEDLKVHNNKCCLEH